jgi:hypothetical protein
VKSEKDDEEYVKNTPHVLLGQSVEEKKRGKELKVV